MGYSSQTFTAFQTSLKCILSFEALWGKKYKNKQTAKQNRQTKPLKATFSALSAEAMLRMQA